MKTSILNVLRFSSVRSQNSRGWKVGFFGVTLTLTLLVLPGMGWGQVTFWSENFGSSNYTITTSSAPWRVLNITNSNNYLRIQGNNSCNIDDRGLIVRSSSACNYVNNDDALKIAYNTTPVNASIYADLKLDFQWKGLGELNYDYWEVVICPGTLSPATSGNWSVVGSGKYCGQSSTQTVSNLTIPSSYNYTSFYIGFRWRNDNSVGGNTVIIDNVAIKGIPTCIQPTAYLTVTAPTTPSPLSISTCTYAGEYNTINSVVSGSAYQFSSSIASDWLVLTDASNNVLTSGTSPINWTANFNGTVRLHVSTNSSCGTQSACRATTVTCTSCSPPCTPTGNPAVYGSGSWIGYVYNSSSPGAFSSYQGFVTEPTVFDRTHNSASGATVNHCSTNQDLFAIRYRNTTNWPAGFYTFTVGGDDGVRFSIDGGDTWLINQWADQGYTTVSSASVYLSGNTNMVFEYYENGGGSRSSFNYTYSPSWQSAWVSMNTGSPIWCAGETRTISVSVTNAGTATWTNASPDINIGVKWNGDADYFVRTDANNLAPGATQTYSLTITAPLTTGPNNLTFDVVNEQNFWFATNTNGGGPGNVVYTSSPITISGGPSVNAGSDQTVCAGSQVTLTGTGATTYSWNNGVNNGVSFTAPSASTTYTVTGTDVNGCSNTDQVLVTVNPLPTNVNAGNDVTICAGGSVQLNGSATEVTEAMSSIPNSNGLTYVFPFTTLWHDARSEMIYTAAELIAGGLQAGTLNSIEFNVTSAAAQPMNNANVWIGQTTNSALTTAFSTGLTNVYSGTYAVSGTGWNTITFDNGFTWDGTSNLIIQYCFDNSSYTANTVVEWDNLNDGVRRFNGFFADNSNGCSATGISEAYSNRPRIKLNGTFISSNSYSWSPSNGLSNPNISNPTANPESTIAYTLTVTGANGCSDTDQVIVNVNDSPTVTTPAAPAALCTGNSYNPSTPTVTANGSTITAQGWQIETAAGSNTFTSLTVPYTISIADNGKKVRYFATNSCGTTSSATVTLLVNSTPSVTASASSTLPCRGQEVTLSGGGADTYSWSNGATAASQTLVPSATSTYTVTGTSSGCTATAQVTVTLPAASSSLSGNNSPATCTVNQNGWVHFLNANGDFVASINSQGNNLGQVTVRSYLENAPQTVDACEYPGNAQYATTVMGRHWQISVENQPSSAVLVRLPYIGGSGLSSEFDALAFQAGENQNQDDNILAVTDLGVTKYSGASEDGIFENNCGNGQFSWHPQVSNGLVSGLDNSFGIHSQNHEYITISTTSFSEFWIHGSASNSPLPVELIAFTAQCQNEDVELKWSTASEFNSQYFSLQLSEDGINWTDLYVADAAGYSSTVLEYAYLHANAARAKNYYRLRQFDNDGTVETYSPIMSNCSSDEAVFMTFPNPSAGSFTVVVNDKLLSGENVLSIRDASGKLIQSIAVELDNGSGSFALDGLDLAPGIYYLQLNNGSHTSRVIKHSFR